MNPTSQVGVVVIGRNEGERLMACLASLQHTGSTVVYVDSGSSDGSAARARQQGVRVHELDPSTPFSAARARNEGFQVARREYPGLDYIQFLDGDCTMHPKWLGAAAEALNTMPDLAVVIGALQERNPDASVYNRMCAMEWKSPAGDLTNLGSLGGIMMVRASVFEQLNGFNPHIIAGEDSEFGVRVRLAGHRVTKLDSPMATHDANIHRFGQWWRRAVRSGHAIGQRFSINGRGPSQDCKRELRSVLIWGISVPALIICLLPFTFGASLILAGGYVYLASRIAKYRIRFGDTPHDAWLYARFTVLAKLAEALGLMKFYVNKQAGRFNIIEYK